MTTLATERNDTLPRQASRALLVVSGRFQGEDVQRQLEQLGWARDTAIGRELGEHHLAMAPYDLVVLDVDLGYPTVSTLAASLRLRQPETRVATLLGWWDDRLSDMQPFSDLMIFKPAHP